MQPQRNDPTTNCRVPQPYGEYMKISELHDLLDRAVSDDGHLSCYAVNTLRNELDWLEIRAVHNARTQGLTWSQIGRLLSMTRQAVTKKFGTPKPPFRTNVPVSYSDRHQGQLSTLRADARRSNDSEPVAW